MTLLVRISGTDACVSQTGAVGLASAERLGGIRTVCAVRPRGERLTHLYMADASTAVALLGLCGARSGASYTLMARLMAIVAESFGGLAILCKVSHCAYEWDAVLVMVPALDMGIGRESPLAARKGNGESTYIAHI